MPTAVAIGETAPLGQRPGPTPTPSAVFFRRDPFGPAKVEAGQALRVQLGRLEAGTLVRAVLTVKFNTPLSNVLGNEPDVDVNPIGPNGAFEVHPRARSGTPISFQTLVAGEHAIELNNSYSRINAKLVQITFLQP